MTIGADRHDGRNVGKGVRLLTGLMSLLSGGIFLCFGGWYAVRDVALSGDRPTADATVMKYHTGRGPGIVSIDVEFVTTDGRHARVTVDEFASPIPRIGGAMRVRYDPDHPSWFARDVRQGPSVFLPALSALMTSLAAFAFVFIAVRGGGNSSTGRSRGTPDT